MDSRSRLDEAPTRASISSGIDREERFLRFVDRLRTEQARASIAANAEGGRTGFRRWRRRGLSLAVVVVVTGAVAAFLRASGPSHVRLNALPVSAVETPLVQSAPEAAPFGQRALPPKIAQSEPPESVADIDAPTDRPVIPAPIRPVPGVPSLSNPRPSPPALAEQSAADLPNLAEATPSPAAVTTPPNSIEPVAPQRDAGAVVSPPSTVAAAEVPDPETAKPVLWVYYPQGSSRAEANARSLAARIDSDLTRSDFNARTDLPNHAVIKFSEEKNHALARMIGKSLGVSGYRWKIENTSSSVGSHRNMIEVWLPMK
jgi:hypothetical protein